MRCSAFFALLTTCAPLLAVPARPGWIDGRVEGDAFRYRMVGDEFCNWAETEDGGTLLQNRSGDWTWAEGDGDGGIRPGARLYRPGEATPAASRGLRPDAGWLAAHVAPLRAARDAASPLRDGGRVEGQWNLLLVMIHYPDQNPRFEPSDFDAMMNEPGYNGTGSFNDYYQDLSYGRYGTVATVTQWVEAQHPHDYYGYNQGWDVARELVVEAVTAVDDAVDFSQFDNSGNGRVDALLIVHSGGGAEEGNQSSVWSHRWGLGGQSLVLDGVELDDYTIQPEIQGEGQAAIGVYVHEFGHNLGLPDLYDTDYSSSGLDTWCVMSGGSWGGAAGGNASVPVSFSAFCRAALGWATLLEPEVELVDQPLAASWLSDEIVSLRLPAPNDGQLFLIENRARTGWDRHQPGEGLLVFHVDPEAWGNTDENHPLVDLEQADGGRDLNHGMSADSGDPFPGSTDRREFSDSTLPSARGYDGAASGLALARIGDPADTVTASFFQSFQHQDLVLAGWRVVEDEDGDLWPSAGETVGVVLEFANRGAAVESLALRWLDGPGLEVLEGERELAAVPAGAFDSGAEPFRLRLADGLPAGHLPVALECEDGSGWLQPVSGDIVVGRCDALLVVEADEDPLAPWLREPLEALGLSVETRAARDEAPADLASYGRLVWLTGAAEAPLEADEQAAIDAYLLQGGQAILSGQHWVESLEPDISLAWGVAAGPSAAGPLMLLGDGDGGLFDDGENLLLFGAAGAWNQQLPATTLDALDGAPAPFRWQNGGQPAALRVERDGEDGPGRLLLAGFSLEAVHGAGSFLDRRTVLERVLRWLETGELTSVDAPLARPAGLGLALAPNPFNPTTTLTFDLATPADVRLRVWNIAGQLAVEEALGRLGAGQHRSVLDLQGLSSGLYMVELLPEGEAPRLTRALLIR